MWPAVNGENRVLLSVVNLGDQDLTINRIMAIELAPDDENPTIERRQKAIERSQATMSEAVVNVGDEQSEQDVDDLFRVLNDNRDCVALNVNEIGCYSELSMEIEELPGSKPPYSKPYPASELEKRKIRKIVSEWRDIGVVTDTNSAYASPVLLVKKKTGDSRMAVDFRRLNNQTERMNFPLLNIDDYVALLAKSKLSIVIDLAQGYLQFPIDPKDRHKTTFIISEETGECTPMIFGLTNAPFYFTKMMRCVLGLLRNKVVLFYLDDVLIPGRDWIDLKEWLILVFEALLKAGLTVRLSKCEFLKQRVTYLGFEISAHVIEPGERKLRAVEDCARSNTVYEAWRFLGLAGSSSTIRRKIGLASDSTIRTFECNDRIETAFIGDYSIPKNLRSCTRTRAVTGWRQPYYNGVVQDVCIWYTQLVEGRRSRNARITLIS